MIRRPDPPRHPGRRAWLVRLVRLAAGVVLGLLLGALLDGGADAAEPRIAYADDGEPVRIEDSGPPNRAVERSSTVAGAVTRVEVGTGAGRYCLTSHRDNPILSGVFAHPGGGELAVPTSCPR